MNFDIKKVKICVSIPIENVEEVRNAVFRAGAGNIGNYTNCSKITKCLGTFRPNDKANPYIGNKNKLEYVNEENLEVICDINKVKNVLTELRKAHPYEEPAIEIFPLIDEDFFI